MGGRGMAGSKHHHRTWINRWHPGYFGKVGMRHFHKVMNNYYCPIINVNSLWTLVGKKPYNAPEGKGVLIDVVEHGYFKVLGAGTLPPYKIVVRARYISKKAEAKSRLLVDVVFYAVRHLYCFYHLAP